MLIAAFFPSSPSRFHPWAACGDLQGNQNERRRTSGQRQILVSLDCAREDCSGSLWHENRRWIQVFINSHLLPTKTGLPLTKALTEILWVDCNPQPPSFASSKKNQFTRRGKWKNKAKQNKIKIVRYLTETKLWRNAIISLKLIDLRTGKIELKIFFLATEIIIK